MNGGKSTQLDTMRRQRAGRYEHPINFERAILQKTFKALQSWVAKELSWFVFGCLLRLVHTVVLLVVVRITHRLLVWSVWMQRSWHCPGCLIQDDDFVVQMATYYCASSFRQMSSKTQLCRFTSRTHCFVFSADHTYILIGFLWRQSHQLIWVAFVNRGSKLFNHPHR